MFSTWRSDAACRSGELMGTRVQPPWLLGRGEEFMS
jgi:hypothetical protein